MMPQSGETTWVGDVIVFWLDDVGPKRWFVKDEALDQEIRRRFGECHRALASMDAAALIKSPQRALAALIVLDQFSRNIYRGSREAFASDGLAREIADQAIAEGHDKNVRVDGRIFFYLPFEHSERLEDQARSVALIEELGDATFTQYAVAHREVIARFNRFPHRNAVLGRNSTPDELAYLAEPGSGF